MPLNDDCALQDSATFVSSPVPLDATARVDNLEHLGLLGALQELVLVIKLLHVLLLDRMDVVLPSAKLL